jgi:hypothetical protein
MAAESSEATEQNNLAATQLQQVRLVSPLPARLRDNGSHRLAC